MVNWVSSVLTSDDGLVFSRYMFGEMPWDDPDLYRVHSPLMYVGNVTTPTMLSVVDSGTAVQAGSTPVNAKGIVARTGFDAGRMANTG
jgi:hypothetical protein